MAFDPGGILAGLGIVLIPILYIKIINKQWFYKLTKNRVNFLHLMLTLNWSGWQYDVLYPELVLVTWKTWPQSEPDDGWEGWAQKQPKPHKCLAITGLQFVPSQTDDSSSNQPVLIPGAPAALVGFTARQQVEILGEMDDYGVGEDR